MPKRTLLITLLIIILTGGIAATSLYIGKRPGQPQKEPVISPSTEPEEITPETTPTEPNEIDTSDWKTYRNEEYGFEINYPREWERASENEEVESSLLFAVYFRNPSWIAYEGIPPMVIYVFDKAVLKGNNLKEWLKKRDIDFPYEFLEHNILFNKLTLITRTHDIYGFAFYQAWIYSNNYLYAIGVGGDENITTLKKLISGFNFLYQESEKEKEN